MNCKPNIFRKFPSPIVLQTFELGKSRAQPHSIRTASICPYLKVSNVTNSSNRASKTLANVFEPHLCILYLWQTQTLLSKAGAAAHISKIKSGFQTMKGIRIPATFTKYGFLIYTCKSVKIFRIRISIKGSGSC